MVTKMKRFTVSALCCLLLVVAAAYTASAQPAARFTDNGNNTVFDTATGLIWTKDGNTPGPAACKPGTLKTWRGAQDYIDCLNTNNYLGFKDWRLPDLTEMQTLILPGRENMAAWLNSNGFVNTQDTFYWTSTAAKLSLNATAVNVHYGFSYLYKKTESTFNAWPVRGNSN